MLPTEDIEPRIPLTFNPFEERPLLDAYRHALSQGIVVSEAQMQSLNMKRAISMANGTTPSRRTAKMSKQLIPDRPSAAQNREIASHGKAAANGGIPRFGARVVLTVATRRIM